MTIQDYVQHHTERGECNCGKCIDRGNAPDPSGHVADLVFFKVAATNSPTREDFVEIIKQSKGQFGDLDPLDGNEHNYLELGGWIGDQGLAMQFMGLGVLLGVFDLLSPALFKFTGEDALRMAQAGMLSVQLKRSAAWQEQTR